MAKKCSFEDRNVGELLEDRKKNISDEAQRVGLSRVKKNPYTAIFMSLLAVKWYEYAGQSNAWQTFWQDLFVYLPVTSAVTFFEGETDKIWASGAYDLTWACGGDVALNPKLFCPLVVPVFDRAPTAPGTYQSLILRHKNVETLPHNELRIGINGPLSTSGHLSLAHWWHEQDYPLPKEVLVTGGHEASVQALLAGKVDLIALDSQGWHLLQRAYPDLEQKTDLIGKTRILPAPPLCTPAEVAKDKETLHAWRSGFDAAHKALSNGTLSSHNLGISGFHVVSIGDYAALSIDLHAQITADQVLVPLP